VSISAPEIVVETIINTGFANVIANASTLVPLIFTDFPAQYSTDTNAFLTGPNFKVNTLFSYQFNPAELPAFNIVLTSEDESPSDRKMYLNDDVETLGSPAGENTAKTGSDWACGISIIVRTEKVRQCIILYNIVKWLMLGNRMTLEGAGIKTSKFSGSDLAYSPTQPTMVFNRQLRMDCRVYNTVDTIATDLNSTTIQTVLAQWPDNVTVLPDETEFLGG
jgi:hypothetical protein